MPSLDKRRQDGATARATHPNVPSVLLLLCGLFAVFAALLARYGFTGRDHGFVALLIASCVERVRILTAFCLTVVGIDLGTTYSVVAISHKNNVTAIADRDGHVLVPSTVAYLPHGGSFSYGSLSWILSGYLLSPILSRYIMLSVTVTDVFGNLLWCRATRGSSCSSISPKRATAYDFQCKTVHRSKVRVHDDP